MTRRTSIFVFAVTAALALPIVGKADDKGKGRGNDKKPSQETIVNFGQPQPQTPDGAPVGAAVTHFLDPEDVTISKDSILTLVVNGGGHGIAIHPVSKDTTRANIAEDLCDGLNNETGFANRIADRRARFAKCNNTVPSVPPAPPVTTVVVTPAVIDGFPVLVTGTGNLDYTITDGDGDVIIHTGFNVNFPATATVPAIVKDNPRVDDPDHTVRHFATSGRAPAGESAATAANRAGGFLTGSGAAPGNRLQVRFHKPGRYLIICMNRGHALNDHMFGFVNVVGDDDEDK
jgi:hypothetical protein